MSFLIGCKNKNGIVLAADSMAIDVNASGQVHEMSVRRLTQLSDTTAILAGGAASGVHMAHTLKSFIADEGLTDVHRIYQAALPFLASEYERFMRKACEVSPLDPIHHVHFILGGKGDDNPEQPFRLYFLWTKRNLPRLDGDEIQSVFTVPRVFRLEHRLGQISTDNAGVNQMMEEAGIAIRQQADIHEEVAGPFSFAVIDQDGLRLREEER